MSLRADRVRSQVRRELSAMLERGQIKDPRLTGLITISDVEVSRDLQHATIFVSVMGGEPEQALAGLERAAGYVRGQLGRRLRLRLAPHLHFRLDASFEYGARMDRLLETLEIPPEEPEGPEPAGEDLAGDAVEDSVDDGQVEAEAREDAEDHAYSAGPEDRQKPLRTGDPGAEPEAE